MNTRYIAYEQIGHIRDHLILEAEIPQSRIQRCVHRKRLKNSVSRIVQSNWFVAAVCAVVSLSVVAWIVSMGQEGPAVFPPLAESIEEPDVPSETVTEMAPISEEEQIKQRVLDFMAESNAQKDPSELFAHFAGDFSVTDFNDTNDKIMAIRRKGAVMKVTAPHITYYGVEAAGAIYYAAYIDSEADMVGHLPLNGDVPEKSTIFTVFGMDTSVLYGAEAEGESAPLTADMLTVSEDKKTCLFSHAYLDELTKELCSSLGFTDELTRDVLEKYQAGGVYSVEENKVTFTIELSDTVLGEIYQSTSYAVDADGQVQASTHMRYSNPSLGIETPIESQIQYKDIVYRDGTPISGTIQLSSIQDASYYEGSYQGAPYITAVKTVVAQYELDVSDGDTPKATARYESRMEESYQGEAWSIITEIDMKINRSTTRAFSFEHKMGGETITAMKAGKLTFGTPAAFGKVPQKVTDAITDYILKQEF